MALMSASSSATCASHAGDERGHRPAHPPRYRARGPGAAPDHRKGQEGPERGVVRGIRTGAQHMREFQEDARRQNVAAQGESRGDEVSEGDGRQGVWRRSILERGWKTLRAGQEPIRCSQHTHNQAGMHPTKRFSQPSLEHASNQRIVPCPCVGACAQFAL